MLEIADASEFTLFQSHMEPTVSELENNRFNIALVFLGSAANDDDTIEICGRSLIIRCGVHQVLKNGCC